MKICWVSVMRIFITNAFEKTEAFELRRIYSLCIKQILENHIFLVYIIRSKNILISVSNMATETLSIVLVLNPAALDGLSKEPQFHKMVLDLVLLSEEKSIRTTAMEEFLQIATRCSPSPNTIIVFIAMLFKVLNKHQQAVSKEFFQVLLIFFIFETL